MTESNEKHLAEEVRCIGCGRALAQDDGMKCSRCVDIEARKQDFGSKPHAATWNVVCLWRVDDPNTGAHIYIRKDVRNERPEGSAVTEVSYLHLEFHVYNNVDPSTAYAVGQGTCVNPPDSPFHTFDEALNCAYALEEQAIASGRWVRTQDLRTR